MSRSVNISGQVFGRLTAIEACGYNKHGKTMWRCVCSCGGERFVVAGDLRSGNTKSCGCLVVEQAISMGARNVTHGLTGSPEFRTWSAMIDRCTNKSGKNYRNYGHRGITVCDEWMKSFERFLADMGPRQKGHTIERKDNNGNYEPSNCVWATNKDQSRNRRSTRLLSHGGRSMPISAWAEEKGIQVGTLWRRLSTYGWSADRAIDTPVQQRAVR